MEEITYNNAKIRIHGTANQERVKKATEKFASAIMRKQARAKKKEETA